MSPTCAIPLPASIPNPWNVIHQQQLESMWWTEDGSSIFSSHSDGSYCCWTLGAEDENEEEEKSDVPYGEKETLYFLSKLPATS